MKLLYTDMWQDISPALVEEARSFAETGKRVFYIAPNSLSFEKERQVLQALPQEASFRITVTRFGQMARYLTLTSVNPKQYLDDVGLTMIFYKVLLDLSEQDLQLYRRVKEDSGFIQQLVDLYQELQTANLTIADLSYLEPAKAADLQLIFQAVESLMTDKNCAVQSSLSFLSQEIKAGRLDLSQVVVIIDGFTRFSAEEEQLVDLLEAACHEVVIGTYASQTAYRTNYLEGHVYQASVAFLTNLRARYQTKASYLASQSLGTSFEQLTQLFEQVTSFSNASLSPLAADDPSVQIWRWPTVKEEIEAMAKKIRQLVQETDYQYKDITVLVGDLSRDQLAIELLFKQFDIPHYVASSQSMKDHPLVNLIDSLERIKRYHYRAEDVLNLLKSGLYGHFEQAAIDQFEQYLLYADIKGRQQFIREFSVNGGQGQYDLPLLNQLREALIGPLDRFLNSRPQKAQSLLKKFNSFLAETGLPENMQLLTQFLSLEERENHQQVWANFVALLEECHLIFGEDKLAVRDFLAILRSGMLAGTYRTLPARVNVVKVQSYDLVMPHHNQLIFAIGLTRDVFPLLHQNKSLLTDEERQLINQKVEQTGRLEIPSRENSQRNLYLALSLFNSADVQLILSYSGPGEGENRSPYLALLEGFGLKEQGAPESKISHYKEVLARLLAVNHLQISQQVEEGQSFWTQALVVLRQQLAAHQLQTEVLDLPITSPLSAEVLSLRFAEQKCQLSVSALTTFYNNQYLYFLRYVLRLQEQTSIHPDARRHGSYLHKILENFMADQSPLTTEAKLTLALEKTRQDKHLGLSYQQSQEDQFSQTILETIAGSVVSALARNQAVSVAGQEVPFDFWLTPKLKVGGLIDRLDTLVDGSQGIVDYKSGDKAFQLIDFYHGLDSQLVTYLQVLKQLNQPLFGAMYLQLTEPQLTLKELKNLDQLAEKAQKTLTYKGVFSEDRKEYLANGFYQLKKGFVSNTYSQEELSRLLAHNQHLFETAYRQIMTGHFLINPYTRDGRTVSGNQLKSITRFSADRHMSYARAFEKFNETGKKQRELLLGLMEENDGN
ncbi:ATP-dependent nuclease subunit B [Streptococcus cuniculipharyngis]|uniref:ATP-dependent nuclease subunit B n=1 Tax=Streptococcus cuniculipharyngis TaxID=1562651 RepID=A0A5C5SCX0_9STRE|nr:ATP-dependent nuclease subunit B [Streptococcus cuniculipharyngis]TWS98030.1 ATP-dependent nuclease subunit B [Streptococcus cuniculipharyngis]